MIEAAERTVEADIRVAIDVVAQLKIINGAAIQVLRDARATNNGDLALKAIDRIQRQLELQAKLIGDLSDGATVNVVVSPQWVELRTMVLTTLQDHPEARAAVAEAITRTEESYGA